MGVEKYGEGERITLNGFLSEIGNERKDLVDMVNNVFEEDKKLGKDSKNLKDGFENFLKYEKKEINILDAKNELLCCENQTDVKRFIENHQGVRNVSGEILDRKNRESKAANDEASAANDEASAANDEASAANDEASAANDEASAANDEASAANKGAEVKVTGTEVKVTGAEVKVTGAEADKLNKDGKIVEKSREELMKDAKDVQNRLFNKYPTLKTKTDETYQDVKSQLEKEGVLEQLRNDNYDENFINDYISLRTTLEELKNNRTSYEKDDISYFDRVVKNLQKSCNIPDTSLDKFSMENMSETRRDLFSADIGNERLIKLRDDNKDKRDYGKLFKISEEKLINKYGNLFMQNDNISPDLKLFFTQYQTNPNIRNYIGNIKRTPGADEVYKNDAMYINYKNMISELNIIRDSVESRTKNLIEEMCLITQVNGMARCIGEEKFTFNKAREIKIDEKDGSMILDGHIEGVDFSVRHNPNENWAPLQTSSKLIESEDGNSFEIGNNSKQKFKRSPYTLPGQNIVFNIIKEAINPSVSSAEKIETVDNYIENMQDNITGKVEAIYENANQAHDYMKEQTEGEKIVNKSLSLIQGIKPSIDFTQTINKTNNAGMFDFMRILNYNIENSSPEEKGKLDRCIDEIKRITNNYKANEGSSRLYYSEDVAPYLENNIWLEGATVGKDETRTETNQNEQGVEGKTGTAGVEVKDKQDQRLGLLFDMFTHFNTKKNTSDGGIEGHKGGETTRKIINDLYMELHDVPQEKRNAQQQEVNNRITNEERAKATSDLESKLEGFPPSPTPPSSSMA